MELEVEVISTETIKPSSPTPSHLRHYQLSFLDQISPPVYNPLVLFYPTTESTMNVDQKHDHLRQSLSDFLTCFYPLAGRIKDNSYVECNDEGVPYVKTLVKSQLSDVVPDPIPGELNKMLSFALDEGEEVPLGIQVNVFDCGGLAVGLCISHKVADAMSFLTFIKSWAAAARGEIDKVSVQFVSASLFPPKNISGFKPSTGITKDIMSTKRFVFSLSKIEEIRAQCSQNDTAVEEKRKPSRVEALSAFIWSRFVCATKQDHGRSNKLYTIVHAVNLRTRMDPPLPEYSFGNLYRVAMTIPSTDDVGHYHSLVRQMRESLSKIDNEYVRKLQEGDEHLEFMREGAERFLRGETVSFAFTSLCRFPMYEADFGWGKPVRVASVRLSFSNLVTFMDTLSGDGIEAWINLTEDDMRIFEVDEELLKYVD